MPRPPAPLPAELPDVIVVGDHLVAAGRLRRRDLWAPLHGVRIAADGPDDWRGLAAEEAFHRRCRVTAAVLPKGVGFGSLTAARLWSVPLPLALTDDELHVVALPGSWPTKRPGIRSRQLKDRNAFLVERDGLPVIDPATLACHLALALPTDDLVAAIDALLHVPVFPQDGRPFLTPDDLRERLSTYRGPGRPAAAWAITRARTGAESRPESLLRLAIVAGGLPEPRLNLAIHDDDGRFLGRGDMVYEQYRLVVEYDGDHHRSDTTTYNDDLERIDRLMAAGWRVLRITAGMFFGQRTAAVERVRSALLAAGWRPSLGR
ncbi:endonuclease domain-containing protein [Nakamurella flava]|nr:DUF559 domain-containing protein [Nakamurella flava]